VICTLAEMKREVRCRLSGYDFFLALLYSGQLESSGSSPFAKQAVRVLRGLLGFGRVRRSSRKSLVLSRRAAYRGVCLRERSCAESTLRLVDAHSVIDAA